MLTKLLGLQGPVAKLPRIAKAWDGLQERTAAQLTANLYVDGIVSGAAPIVAGAGYLGGLDCRRKITPAGFSSPGARLPAAGSG
jgi:hypothetical protein